MDHEVSFIGEISAGGRYEFHHEDRGAGDQPVSVLEENLDRGAHNQRSHITVTAVLNDHLWIEDMVQLVESQASCEVFGLLKRPDEKWVTERAYDNPKFVEDLVRDVAGLLTTEPRIDAYVVESENFESIHQPFGLRPHRARQAPALIAFGPRRADFSHPMQAWAGCTHPEFTQWMRQSMMAMPTRIDFSLK